MATLLTTRKVAARRMGHLLTTRSMQSGTPISQEFNILNGNVKISSSLLPAYGPTDSNKVTPSMSWDDTQYQLKSATLTIVAKQNASSINISGAVNLVTFMNSQDVSTIRWGLLDNGSKTDTQDVSSYLNNGANQFYVEYTIPDGVELQTATCSYVVTLEIVLNQINNGQGSGTGTVGTGGTGGTGSTTPITTGGGIGLPSALTSLSTVDWIVIALLVLTTAGAGTFVLLRGSRK